MGGNCKECYGLLWPTIHNGDTILMLLTTFQLIAAAFVADIEVGVVTAIAIIAHEIPQEVGDFLVLLHSGYSKRAALAFNAFSSLAMLSPIGLNRCGVLVANTPIF